MYKRLFRTIDVELSPNSCAHSYPELTVSVRKRLSAKRGLELLFQNEDMGSDDADAGDEKIHEEGNVAGCCQF